jgi:hypothetical protein
MDGGREGAPRTVYIGHHIAGLWVSRGECVNDGVARHSGGTGLGHALLEVFRASADVPVHFIDLQGSGGEGGR